MSELLAVEGVPVVFIDTPELLDGCLTVLSKAKVLGIDTEFIRVSTFFPKLALLQVFDGRQIYLIDAPAISGRFTLADAEFYAMWGRLIDLFNAGSVVKIFHACEEDIELLHYYYGVLPKSVFDTQLACGFLGFEYPMGYQKLVAEMCEKHVEKGDSRSNWLQRPLTSSQLQYAANDVVFLVTIYTRLRQELITHGCFDQFQQDCDAIVLKLKSNEFSSAYLKIKSHIKLSSVPLWRLQKLACWREEVMRKSDVPRNKVATNDALMLLAKKGEVAGNWLFRVEGLSGATVKKYQAELLEILSVRAEASELEFFKAKASLDLKYLKAQQKLVKSFLQQSAQNINMSEQIMIKKKYIESLVQCFALQGDVNEVDLQNIVGEGWRLEYYREALKALVSS